MMTKGQTGVPKSSTDAGAIERESGKLSTRACETLPDGKHGAGDGLRFIVRGDTRAWTQQFTSPETGKRRELGLGRFPDVGLAMARKLASAARDKVRLGVDPVAERERIRAKAAAGETERKQAARTEAATLRRVARSYHEREIEPDRSAKHAAQWINSIEQHLPAKLLDRPIASIEATEIYDALCPLFRKLPETARRIKQRLDAIYDEAVFRKHTSGNPMGGLTKRLKKFEHDPGNFAALPFAEVPTFVTRLQALPGTAARALEFAILTAARTGEVLGMTWDELSDDGAVWTVPAGRMKGREEHTVYLSDAARAVLDRVRGLHQSVVFPSASPSPRKKKQDDWTLSNMAMLELLKREKLNDRTTVHGVCRSSFSTWANETDAARPDVIEACLAHQEADRVRRSYNHATFIDERKALLQKWAAFIAPAPKVEKAATRRAKGGNVVPLRRAGA